MRKIVVTEFMSLDGVVDEPQKWSFSYWCDEIAAFKQEELFASDAMLLGRVTYDGFAKAWPGRTDEAGYADHFNNMPKYVVSKTMKKAEWNNSHILSEHFLQEIAKLKEEDGKDILIHGSQKLVHTLLETGLVDQLNLLVYPIILGKGRKLFNEGTEVKLELTNSKTFQTGVALLTYSTKE